MTQDADTPPPRLRSEGYTLAGGARVRPSTDAVWHRLDGNQVELTAGALGVSSSPSGQPVAVKAPVGLATAVKAEFVIAVRPAGPIPAGGSVVVLWVSAGTVRLRTESGTLTGKAGDVLRASPGAPPRRTSGFAQEKGNEP